jgi:hypothetical protein
MSPQPSTERCTEEFFLVYEFAFRFRTNQGAARERLAGLYGQFLNSDTTGPAVAAALEKDHADRFRWALAEKTGTASELSGALLNLEASLCEAVIRSQRRLIAVHAAALISDRSAALIVGRSGAGKSTLSVALARRGYAVASDDVTLVEPDTLNVLPIPRCFHLDRQSLILLKADGLQFPPTPAAASFLAPSDFGVTATRPCRVRVLVFISGPREERPQLISVPQAEMAARLLQETGHGPLTDGETVGVLSRLAAGAACYKLIPGPLSPTADALAELIDRWDTVPR